MAVTAHLRHFNLLEEIGHGGMGSVYRAFDPNLNREVAIKLLREDLAGDPKFVEDFLREARAAAAISHPHIVQIHSVDDEGGRLFLVMELLTGRTLREIIEKDGPLGEEAALDIAINVAEALRAAYKNNQMIHGDIKPANIFVTQDQGAKVLDFGLAKLANVETPASEGIWGSAYYISPERVGRKAEDFRSDVYSLGASLFHVLTGRPPFEAETPEELALKRLNEKPPLLREVLKNVAPKTEQVVDKMLNKNVLLRYRDYDAVIADLQEAKTEATARRLGVTINVGRPSETEMLQPPSMAAAAPARKSRTPMVVALVLIAVAALGAVGYFAWRKMRGQKPEKPPGEVVKPVTPSVPVEPPQSPVVPPQAVETNIIPVKTAGPTQEELKLIQDEQNAVQAAVGQAAAFFPKYDFASVVSVLQATEEKLQTKEGKKAIASHALSARYLSELKEQFKTEVPKLPYPNGDLQTTSGGGLPGTLSRCDDKLIYFTSQYGGTQMEWASLSSRSWLTFGIFYVNRLGPGETPDLLGKRLLRLAVFCKQYGMMDEAYAGARDAIKYDPTLKKDVDLIFGKLPPAPKPPKVPKPPPAPKPPKTPKPSLKSKSSTFDLGNTKRR